MDHLKIPKLAKIGKIGHAKSTKHKGEDLVASTPKLVAHRKGSSAKAKVLEHGAEGLPAGLRLPPTRHGSAR
jgi:hypothetical protein